MIGHKNVHICTFILSEAPEATDIVKQCIVNQTFPSKRIDVINCLSQVSEILERYSEIDGVWVNIIFGENRIFSDHNEFLADMASESSSVVGTVDEEGLRGRELSYYLFDLKFYK